VIVVVGSPVGRVESGAVRAAGTASQIALAAAGSDRSVQLIGRIGDDPTADAVLIDLARGGVGHVALLRDVSHPTPLEPALAPPADLDDASEAIPPSLVRGLPMDADDVGLGLRYLTGFEVVVFADGQDAAVRSVVADAARWAGARLVVVAEPAASPPSDLPPDAVVFQAPEADPDGVFAALVARFAVALDAGTEPGDAFRASVEATGWTAAAPD
jgi:hypothetical protein